MKPFIFVALAVALLPLPALGNAIIHVKCAEDCSKVEIDGKKGEKVNDKEWRFEKTPAGIFEVEVRGCQEGGWLDVPAEGEVEIQISRQTMLVNGQPCLDKKAKKELEKSRRDAADAEKKAERDRKDQEKKDQREQEKAERERKDQEKKGSPPAAAPQGAKIKLLVVGIAARGLDQTAADLFGEALVGELRKRPMLKVTDHNDISAVLGVDREKQLLGCTDSACMAEIGGALGVDLLVRGTLGRVGKLLLVNLTLIDPKKPDSATTVSEQAKSSADEAFFEQIPRLVDQLLKGRR